MGEAVEDFTNGIREQETVREVDESVEVVAMPAHKVIYGFAKESFGPLVVGDFGIGIVGADFMKAKKSLMNCR